MNQNEPKQSNANRNDKAARRLIFDYTPIIVGSRNLRGSIDF